MTETNGKGAQQAPQSGPEAGEATSGAATKKAAAQGSEQTETSEAQPQAQQEHQASAQGDPQTPEQQLEQECKRLKDQLLRTAADFDNFRKRSRKDVEDAARKARENVLQEVLPVIDNLERADEASRTAQDVQGVAEGVRMVLQQFQEAASKLNLERIEAVGQRFDPSVHDAVQQLETKEHPPGTIIAEITPGYRLNGRLLRAAMVVVARPPSG